MSGELDIEMVVDMSGRTRVRRLVQSYPQRVTLPLYPDEDPGIAYVCVQNPSGGIFADDSLSTTVTVGAGARAVVTSQASTQVFAGDAGPGARHRQTMTVEAGAVLEYLPREVIPQAASTLTQHTSVEVSDGGVYVGWEMVAAGRIAHGERFAFRELDMRTTVSVGGSVVVREGMRLGRGCRQPSNLVGGDYFATMLVVCPGRDYTTLQSALAAQTDPWTEVCAGVGGLPSACGVMVRLVASSAPPLRRAQAELLEVHRRELFGMTPPSRRLV